MGPLKINDPRLKTIPFMKPSSTNRVRTLLALTVALIAGIAMWYFRSSPAAPLAASVAQISAPEPAARPLAEPAASAPIVSEAPAAKDSPEVAATARMYAAHAPLRAPEVANPDSKSNKQILQTMVNKALAQKHGPSSGSTSTPAH